MNFQHYETLQDKSDKYLKYLADQIRPKLTVSELKAFLDDMVSIKGKSSGMDFTEVGDDFDTTGDLEKLTTNQLKKLYEVFISREDNSAFGVQWRFYQYLKYFQGFVIENIKLNLKKSKEMPIDILIELENNTTIFVKCVDILEVTNYNSDNQLIVDFIKTNKLNPDRIFYVAYKSYRNIPRHEGIKIKENSIIPELWVEWIEDDRPFNGEDLVIINDELKVAGFNFTNMTDLLDYAYEYSSGGQVRMHAQRKFLTEVSSGEPEVDLIWKGIMLKENS